MAVRREVLEGILEQGEDEEIVYTLNTEPWGGSPSGVTVVAKCDGVDVSDDVLSGTASVSSDVITLPALGSLTKNKQYRIEVKFTSGSSVFEAYFRVNATE
jgi:hypothetical protein